MANTPIPTAPFNLSELEKTCEEMGYSVEELKEEKGTFYRYTCLKCGDDSGRMIFLPDRWVHLICETSYQPKPEEQRTLPEKDYIPNHKPGLAKKAYNFAKAATKHLAEGNPQVSVDIIEKRLAICVLNECGFYDEKTKTCSHSDCGCNVGREKRYFNKLAWADQECPMGLWSREKPEDVS